MGITTRLLCLLFLTPFLSSCGLFVLGDGAGCFARGTVILTPHGPMPIESIRAGQEVYSWDQEAKKTVIGIVEELITRKDTRPWILELKNSLTLTVTPDHPLYLSHSDKWVPVSELKPGDRLALMDQGTREMGETEVLSVNKQSTPQDTFNLKVRRYENSFAEGVLARFY